MIAVFRTGFGHIFSKHFEYFQALNLGSNNYIRGFRIERRPGAPRTTLDRTIELVTTVDRKIADMKRNGLACSVAQAIGALVKTAPHSESTQFNCRADHDLKNFRKRLETRYSNAINDSKLMEVVADWRSFLAQIGHV